MLDITKKIPGLPDSVEVDGVDYKVNTDFRAWLSFGRMVKGNPLLREFDFIYEMDGLKRKVPLNRQKGFEALLEFYNPKEQLPRSFGGGGEKVVDFVQDASLIFAAFWQFYGIRLTTADLHWHEFLALFRGLKGTKLNDVMEWRSFTPDGSKGMEKWNQRMEELKRSWALETEVTEKDQETLDSFNARFE